MCPQTFKPLERQASMFELYPLVREAEVSVHRWRGTYNKGSRLLKKELLIFDSNQICIKVA